jgi:hypothetical protein
MQLGYPLLDLETPRLALLFNPRRKAYQSP